LARHGADQRECDENGELGGHPWLVNRLERQGRLLLGRMKRSRRVPCQFIAWTLL
jgi:hypothetical protein